MTSLQYFSRRKKRGSVANALFTVHTSVLSSEARSSTTMLTIPLIPMTPTCRVDTEVDRIHVPPLKSFLLYACHKYKQLPHSATLYSSIHLLEATTRFDVLKRGHLLNAVFIYSTATSCEVDLLALNRSQPQSDYNDHSWQGSWEACTNLHFSNHSFSTMIIRTFSRYSSTST